MRENLWPHMLGPLNMPIQSDALLRWSQVLSHSSFVSEKSSGIWGIKKIVSQVI